MILSLFSFQRLKNTQRGLQTKCQMFELPRALPKQSQSIPKYSQSIFRAFLEHPQSILRSLLEHSEQLRIWPLHFPSLHSIYRIIINHIRIHTIDIQYKLYMYLTYYFLIDGTIHCTGDWGGGGGWKRWRVLVYITKYKFFTVLHIFLLESSRFQSIPGIPQNGILAVLPAKMAISIPAEFWQILEWHRNHQNEIASGIDWNGICGIFLNVN